MIGVPGLHIYMYVYILYVLDLHRSCRPAVPSGCREGRLPHGDGYPPVRDQIGVRDAVRKIIPGPARQHLEAPSPEQDALLGHREVPVPGDVPEGHAAIADQRQVRDGFLAQSAIVDVGLEPVALTPPVLDGVGLVGTKTVHRRKPESSELRKHDLPQDVRQGVLGGVDSPIPQVAMDAPSFPDVLAVEPTHLPGRKDISADIHAAF